MIRVLYRWQVDEQRHAEFGRWWHEGTLRIRSTYPGALGSTLLAPTADRSHLAAVARWRSRADLEAFWTNPRGTPFDGATLESAEIFDEIDDLVVDMDAPDTGAS
jgi:heme-degrading monooxygenase HmoA